MMSGAPNMATERTLQSFLQRITQLETNHCKDNTDNKAKKKRDSVHLTEQGNSRMRENYSGLAIPFSNTEKLSAKETFEKPPVFGGSVQWTLEHAMPKYVPAPNQIKKPCCEIPYLAADGSGQRHEVSQTNSNYANLYHFQPHETSQQVRYIYLQDNQQVRVQDKYHLGQQQQFSPRPPSSYQIAWKSVSPGATYPFQHNQSHSKGAVVDSSAYSEPLMMSNSASSKPIRQVTQLRSQPAQESPTAFHPPPPPLQLRQQKQIRTLEIPLSEPPPSKRVQLQTPYHPMPPSPPLTPVARFVTPRHYQVNTLQIMPSSNEQNHQQQVHYLQQQYQQQLLELQQHQQLRFQERYEKHQQEQSVYQQFHQQEYQSQLQQQHFQHQHYQQQQCHQQENQLSQHEQDETICVVERIYFTTPEKENERKNKGLQDTALKQSEKEKEHLTVAQCTTGPPQMHGNCLCEQQQTPDEYHRERNDFHVALPVNGIDESSELYHLHRQRVIESESPEKVLRNSAYKIKDTSVEKFITKEELGSVLLKQETLINSRPKRKVQLRCSAKARKKRLQRESMIVFEAQEDNFANQTDKNPVDEVQEIKGFSSLAPSNEISTNSQGSNTNIVHIIKRDASTQANTECGCLSF